MSHGDLRADVKYVADLTSRLLTELLKAGLLLPEQAHQLRRQADEARQGFAWLHNCGHLNQGYWHDRSVCGGCRFSVEDAEDVEAHYRLEPVEGLGD